MSSTGRPDVDHGSDSKEQTLANIYEEIPFGVWMCDCNGGLRYASNSFLGLLGMSMDEAQGFGWTERISSDDRDSVARWKACVAQERDWDDEHQFRDPQGRLRTLLARGHAVRGESGAIERWIGVHLDITKRKQVEQRLQDALDYADGIIQTVPDPLIVLNAEHRVVSANRAFYRQFSTVQQATEGRPLYELGNGQWDIPAFHTLLKDVLTESASFEDYEVEHHFPDIGRKVMLVSGARLRQEEQQTEMILLAIQDVTDARGREERLRLVQEAQTVQQERERLAHRLHDDIQQMLHAASLHVAVVQQKESSEDNRALLVKAQSLLQDAGRASRDLAVELAPPVLFESGFAAALEWLAEWVKEHHRLQIELALDPHALPDERAVCRLLFETVRELLMNVVKHAETSSAAVKAERGVDGWLHLIVEDQGRGFDAQTMKTDGMSATGLGLASVGRRIRSAGGLFDVESGVSRGTRITMRVPLRQGTS